MKNARAIFAFAVAGTIVSSLAFAAPAKGGVGAGTPKVAPAQKEAQERLDRSVDEAAISLQVSALARLEALAKKYKGTDQEPGLLSRLAEAYQQEAAIRFRIAHGRAHRSGKAVQLDDFKQAMRKSVSTLDRLIREFPKNPDLAEAYYLRAKAFDEISEKAAATRDYLYVVGHFPESAFVTISHMRLAEYAIEDNLHPTAIEHLEAVERKPNDPQYPFALHKLAWSHYNLGNSKRALSYLEKHVALFPKDPKKADTSEIAMRESSLMDIALFYYDGFEKKREGFEPTGALTYFRSIDDGPTMGKMMARYAGLLRAGGFEAEMRAWKKLVLEKEIQRPQSLDVVQIVFEDRVNKRAFDQLGEIAEDFTRIYNEAPKIRDSDEFGKARQLLLSTADDLQKLTIKNKGASEVQKLAASLARLYAAFVSTVKSEDARIPGTHLNLAEVYFQIGDFERATAHYRWIPENWKGREFDVRDAELRAIASRYETLKRKQAIPASLAARGLKQAPEKAKVDAQVEEWVGWVDAYSASIPKNDAAKEASFLNYEFEANRALYAAGDVRRAVRRMLDFAEKRPASDFAVPSASLVLDSSVADQDWSATFDLAKRLRKISAWNGSEFARRLETTEIDSFYKVTESAWNAKNYQVALEGSETCLKRYAKSERAGDCRLLAAKSALALEQKGKASQFLSQVIESAPEGAGLMEAALVQRARIAESRYDLLAAARDYRQYTEKHASPEASVKERGFFVTWINAENLTLASLLRDRKVCPERASGSPACDRVAALLWLEEPSYFEKEPSRVAVALGPERVSVGARENEALWALAVLRWNKALSTKDRLALIEKVGDSWDRVDALAQLQALPRLATVTRDALDTARAAMVQDGQALKAEKASIKRRLAKIAELEAAALKLVKLPWARVKVETLSVTAEAYLDLARQLQTIPAPKGFPEAELEAYKRTLAELAIPFEEKAQDIRRKAFELAAKERIEKEPFERVADAFARDNPSQAKSLADLRKSRENTLKWDLPQLAQVELEAGWNGYREDRVAGLADKPENRARFFRWAWWASLEKAQFHRAAWYLREARQAKALPESSLKLMQSFLLVRAGAQAEGWRLWEEAEMALKPAIVTAEVKR